jgi:casein kinase II subunit alpha
VKIVKVLGTDGLDRYLDKYDIELDPAFDDLIAEKEPAMDWSELVEDKTAHLAHEDALDLIGRLLRYDHASRLTCKEAMDHEYFADVDFE